MEDIISYHFASVKQRHENRHEIEYQLSVRQQPKQSRMCGIGEKADRRPVDPPPIVQLKVVDPTLSGHERSAYLQNPYYFMYASLMAADIDEELHLLRDGKTRSTTGSVVSSLYHLKDIDNADAGFFVFPDLSVRMEGNYRLKLSLFEIIGKEVFHCKSIITHIFVVYSAKRFPGMEESTFLSRSFADQGLKIRIRKEIRVRRKQSKRKEALPNGTGRKGIMYNKRPRKSSSAHGEASDQASSDGESYSPGVLKDKQRGHNIIGSDTTAQPTEPWQGGFSQPAKLLKSETSSSSSPGLEPLENIDRMPNNRSNPMIMGNEMMLPPTNRTYQSPYQPIPAANPGIPKRFQQPLPGHGFPVSVSQTESSTRNQSGNTQDRSASEPTLRLSSRHPNPHQSQWLISHSDPQSNETWYHRPHEESNLTQRDNPSVEGDPHSPSPHMEASVFYSTNTGTMGLNQPMDAAYGTRRAGPAGSARFHNHSVGQQHSRSGAVAPAAPDTYSHIAGPTMRNVDGASYSRYSPQLSPNPRQQHPFDRQRHSADSFYPSVTTFQGPGPLSTSKHQNEQEHMMYRDPYPNNRRASSNVTNLPQNALHPHENSLSPASHNTVNMPGALEWYDESGKYSQGKPPSQLSSQPKHGQQSQRQQQKQQQQQQASSSMYPVSKARMYYSDVPRR